MEKLLRGLNKNHINAKDNSVKPAGFIFRDNCFSVFRQADRTICEALEHFRLLVAQYDFYAFFEEKDLSPFPYNIRYSNTPSLNNPFHGTITVSVSSSEHLARQQYLVIRQELARISKLINYELDCLSNTLAQP